MGKSSREQRFDALQNLKTLYGTSRSRSAGVRAKPRRPLTRVEVEALEADNLVRKALADLPLEAAEGVTISGEAGASLNQALDDLSAESVLATALYDARRDGGAAIWVVSRDLDDPALPADWTTVSTIDRLVSLSAWDLTPDPASIQTNSLKPGYGLPQVYRYLPSGSMASALAGKEIHASHLLRVEGDPVPRGLAQRYRWWGASAIEGFVAEYAAYAMINSSGSELLYEFGGKKFTLQDFNEMAVGGEGVCSLEEWQSIQADFFSALRGYVVGPGDDVQQFTPSLAGWAELYDRLAQALAAAVGEPLSKFFGQSPGGLSTDDGAAIANWELRKRTYRTSHVTPLYQSLVDRLLLTKQGPTSGVVVPYSVEYQDLPPDPTERAQALASLSPALTSLLKEGVLSVEEVRKILADLKLLALS